MKACPHPRARFFFCGFAGLARHCKERTLSAILFAMPTKGIAHRVRS
jgi:hypothetical protein